MNDWLQKNWGIVVVLLIAGALIWFFASRTGDGLAEQAPSTIAFLAGEKSYCEESVRKLHQEAIKGEDEYHKALTANHAFVAYLRTVVVQRKGDPDEIQKETKRFGTESAKFCTWADDQLKIKKYGAVEFDPAKIIKEIMKTVEWQGKEAREELLKEIDRHKFNRWEEIIKDK